MSCPMNAPTKPIMTLAMHPNPVPRVTIPAIHPARIPTTIHANSPPGSSVNTATRSPEMAAGRLATALPATAPGSLPTAGEQAVEAIPRR